MKRTRRKFALMKLEERVVLCHTDIEHIKAVWDAIDFEKNFGSKDNCMNWKEFVDCYEKINEHGIIKGETFEKILKEQGVLDDEVSKFTNTVKVFNDKFKKNKFDNKDPTFDLVKKFTQKHGKKIVKVDLIKVLDKNPTENDRHMTTKDYFAIDDAVEKWSENKVYGNLGTKRNVFLRQLKDPATFSQTLKGFFVKKNSKAKPALLAFIKCGKIDTDTAVKIINEINDPKVNKAHQYSNFGESFWKSISKELYRKEGNFNWAQKLGDSTAGKQQSVKAKMAAGLKLSCTTDKLVETLADPTKLPENLKKTMGISDPQVAQPQAPQTNHQAPQVAQPIPQNVQVNQPPHQLKVPEQREDDSQKIGGSAKDLKERRVLVDENMRWGDLDVPRRKLPLPENDSEENISGRKRRASSQFKDVKKLRVSKLRDILSE